MSRHIGNPAWMILYFLNQNAGQNLVTNISRQLAYFLNKQGFN